MCQLERYRTKSDQHAGCEYSTHVYRPNQLPGYAMFDEVLILAYGLGENFSQYNLNFRLCAETLVDKYHIPVITFDYRGAGRSNVFFQETSLNSRMEDLRHILLVTSRAFPHANIILCGHSAGAAIAARLSSKLEVENTLHGVILTAPAAYHPEAWEKCFGNDFSEVIRGHRTWADSHEFKDFGKFTGEKGIVICDRDDVVTLDIPQEYIHHSEGSRVKMLDCYPPGHKVFSDPTHAIMYRKKTLAYADIIGNMTESMLAPTPRKISREA